MTIRETRSSKKRGYGERYYSTKDKTIIIYEDMYEGWDNSHPLAGVQGFGRRVKRNLGTYTVWADRKILGRSVPLETALQLASMAEPNAKQNAEANRFLEQMRAKEVGLAFVVPKPDEEKML